MILLTCFIFAEILTPSYTAPKLGHPLFDPLAYEATSTFVEKNILPSISGKVIRKFLRMPETLYNTSKKPCAGYDYDDKLCKLLNDRVVCGYNKNLGQPQESKAIVDLGNGCFSRGDRIECGYLTGPQTNSRHTSVRASKTEDKHANLTSNNESKLLKTTGETSTYSSTERIKTTKIVTATQSTPTTMPQSTPTPTVLSSSKTKIDIFTKIYAKPSTVPTKTILTRETKATENWEQSSSSAKPKFICLDKNNSIFCYELNGTKYFTY